MENEEEKDHYKTSKILYIIEATLEYFISLAFTEVYICRLTSLLNFSDRLTGIITAFVQLGCGFQILAVFINKEKNVKVMVALGHIVSQIFFCMCYFVPFFNMTANTKVLTFICLLLSAYIMHNIIYPFKISWYMSLINKNKRGDFTANKEIVSLIGGMAFSYFLGWIIDEFTVDGTIKIIAFLIIGLIMLFFMIGHTLTLIFSKEREDVLYNKKLKFKELLLVLFDKKLLIIIPISILWNIASCISRPFMGTFQQQELGFSAQLSSIIVIVGSFIRVVFSKPFGRVADKKSFAYMLIICMIIEAVAFLLNSFTNPNYNTKFFYAIYYAFYCIGMAGINSSTINLIYDYIDKDKITGALALNSSLSGMLGFLATVIVSPLVAVIQQKGSTIFGISIYAQQLLSFISFIVALIIILYLVFVVRKLKINR